MKTDEIREIGGRKALNTQKERGYMEISVYNNEELGAVRVVLIEDKLWFVMEEICEILGLSEDIFFLLEDWYSRSMTIPTQTGHTDIKVVDEYGLHALIMSSRKPEAKKFKRWVNSEVIPAARLCTPYGTGSLKAETMKLKQQLLLT